MIYTPLIINYACQSGRKKTEVQKLYKVSEFAEMFGISKPTAYNLIKNEDLDIIRIGDRGIRIPEAELERLFDKFHQNNNKETKPRAPDDRDSLY